MPTLTLKYKDKDVKRFRFSQGTTITIGRADDNDITVENLAVSSHHAKIESVGNGYLLTDLKSKNGTFVNDRLVSSLLLKNGDIITIAKHALVFAYAEDEQSVGFGDDADMGRYSPPPMDTDSNRGIKAEGTSTGPVRKKPNKEPVGVLTYLSGGEGEIELDADVVRVGKSPSADIIVGGIMVGKTAFTINKEPDGYRLVYVAGISKPRVNGEAVRDSVPLMEFDTISIGSATFQFVHKKF